MVTYFILYRIIDPADPLRSPTDLHKAGDRDLGATVSLLCILLGLCLIHRLVYSHNQLSMEMRVEFNPGTKVFETKNRLRLTR